MGCAGKSYLEENGEAAEEQGDDQQWAGKATSTATSRKLSMGKTTGTRPQQSVGGGQDVELLSKSRSWTDALERRDPLQASV